MKGFLLGACLLASSWLYAQCTVLSFDVEVVSNVTCPEGSDGFATAISIVVPFGGTTTYEWSSPGYPTLIGASVNNLQATTYTVTLNNDLGCSASQTIIVSEPSPPQITVTTQDVSCFGMNDGQAIVTVLGDAAPYSVDWGAENPNALFSGIYPFEVTDNASCVFYDTVTIDQADEILFQFVASNVSCNGSSDGGINLTMNTPGNYTYLWSMGEATEDLNNIPADDYNVTITDDNNCSVSVANIEVLEPEAIVLSVAIEDVSCFGGNDGSSELIVIGGNAPLSVDWGGFNPDSLIAGNYIVNVVDVTGCQAQESFIISEPDQISLSFTSTDASCFGYNDGTVVLSINGGVAPYVENWFGADVDSLFAGEYAVSVFDANGCLTEEVFAIAESDSLLWSYSVQNVNCFGDNDGLLLVDSVAGGTFPYSFSWTAFDSLFAGNYPIMITDENGCVLSDTILVLQPDTLLVSVAVSDVLCAGDSSGVVHLEIEGGMAPYQTNWQGMNTNTFPAGVHYYTVLDDNTCSYSDSVVVNQPDSLQLGLTISDISCYGFMDGTALANIQGGVPPYSMDFMGSDINQLAEGSYVFYVTDLNLCEDSVAFYINEPDSLFASSDIQNVSCFGLSDGVVAVNVSGGVGDYIIDWLGESPSALSAGVYQYIVSDINNCEYIDSVQIIEPEELQLEVTVQNASCFGFSDGVVESIVDGGISPYFYNWGMLDTMSVPAGNYTLSVVDAHACETQVLFEVTDGAEIFIDLEVVDVTCFESEDGSIYSGVSGGISPYLYLWSNGSDDAFVEELSAGTYDLLVTDEMGCEQYASVNVEEPNEISISIEIGLEACTGSGDGSFAASVQGGVNPYMLEWSTGASGEVVNNVLEGSYSLLVVDANGCLADEVVDMTGEEPCFLIPTLFTPNADSYNDIWSLQGMGKFTEAKVQVYNRAGLLVFSSIGYAEAWDGTYNGSPMPMADYYYLIDLQDGNDPLQGVVTLKR